MIIKIEDQDWEVVDVRAPEVGEYFIGRVSSTFFKILRAKNSALGSRTIIKKIKWRAKAGGTYYTVDLNSESQLVVDDEVESGQHWDDKNFENNNYFETREMAQAAIDRFYNVEED